MNKKKNHITRYGVYGIILRDSSILLGQKKSGPYKGRWGLPGGAIEFGEDPETTLKRELSEEAALAVGQLKLLYIATTIGEYEEQEESYKFHQIGMIYQVTGITSIPDRNPEEEVRWVDPSKLKEEELTPFAKEAVQKLIPLQSKTWRPKNGIRAKTIGIAKQHDKILVCEVLDDQGMLKGWCPLGGGIEYGETAEEALKRELMEELGTTIEILGSATICENMYEHYGTKGHEIVFAFPIKLNNPDLYETKRFQIYEDSGTAHWAEWIEIEKFQNGETILFSMNLSII